MRNPNSLLSSILIEDYFVSTVYPLVSRLPQGSSNVLYGQSTVRNSWSNVYLDDILISGVSEDDHLHTLKVVLERLQTAGLDFTQDKCKFLVPY